MKKGYQKDKTLARGKDVYLGIDVHSTGVLKHGFNFARLNFNLNKSFIICLCKIQCLFKLSAF